jgi:hypothetical protein
VSANTAKLLLWATSLSERGFSLRFHRGMVLEALNLRDEDYEVATGLDGGSR